MGVVRALRVCWVLRPRFVAPAVDDTTDIEVESVTSGVVSMDVEVAGWPSAFVVVAG
jgi:hypothetical protein